MLAKNFMLGTNLAFNLHIPLYYLWQQTGTWEPVCSDLSFLKVELLPCLLLEHPGFFLSALGCITGLSCALTPSQFTSALYYCINYLHVCNLIEIFSPSGTWDIA